MAIETKIKQQIYQMIETLPVEKLPDLLRFLKDLLQPGKSSSNANVAPIYQVHQHAIDTGVPDLASQHDHYLYGTNKNDA